MPGSRSLAGLLLAPLLAAGLVPASTPSASAAGTDLQRVRLIAGSPLTTFRVEIRPAARPGLCAARRPKPAHARYRGNLEVGRQPDGRLFLIDEIPFEDYLKGIAEVPVTWPEEALKAQVVAARTYALSRMGPRRGEAAELDYDLCATDACQVYRGMGVEAGPWGERWVTAVEATRGQALLYKGSAASTLYFSTSPGRTFGNDEVFGSAPLPYLRSVTENDDTASPTSRWSVSLPLSDLAEMLRLAGTWKDGAIRKIALEGSKVIISGDASEIRLEADRFRTQVSAQAPCVSSNRYPPLAPSGKRLPQTLPSRWFSVEMEGSAARFTGRGWGHGVGLVQWGAYGKAKRGLDYSAILAAYYGNLLPEAHPDPGLLRIGLATDIEELTVSADGAASLQGVPAGASPGPGPWRFRGGQALSVVAGSLPAAQLAIGAIQMPSSVGEDGTLEMAFSLPKAAKVRIRATQDQKEVGATSWEPHEEGQTSLFWTPDLRPGDYAVEVQADDGIDKVHSNPEKLTVEPAAPVAADASRGRESPAQARSANGPGRFWPLIAALAAIVVALATAGVLAIRRRPRSARQSPRGPAGTA
ncbi:MAG: SpoIID/LytB domain-containing protein [Actinomycetota bacterium]